jgi:hypothetical protein
MSTAAILPESPTPKRARAAVRFLLKLILLPFRFAWLLIVWVRLRSRTFPWHNPNGG